MKKLNSWVKTLSPWILGAWLGVCAGGLSAGWISEQFQSEENAYLWHYRRYMKKRGLPHDFRGKESPIKGLPDLCVVCNEPESSKFHWGGAK